MTTSHRDRDDLLVEPDDLLVGPGWLRRHLHDPRLRMVEVDVNAAAYSGATSGGGAVERLHRPEGRRLRHRGPPRLPGPGAPLRDHADSVVVFHGYAPALGLWMLRLFGHRHVRILNASRQGWLSAGGTLTTDASRPVPSEYVLGGRTPRSAPCRSRWRPRSAIRRSPSRTSAAPPSTAATSSGLRAGVSGAGGPGTFPARSTSRGRRVRRRRPVPGRPRPAAGLRAAGRGRRVSRDHVLHHRRPRVHGVVRTHPPAQAPGRRRLRRFLGAVGADGGGPGHDLRPEPPFRPRRVPAVSGRAGTRPAGRS